MGHPAPRMIDRAVRQDEAEAELLEMQRDLRRRQIKAARLLHTINASYHYVYRGVSSLGAYGEKYGFSAREARILAEVGKALELKPDIEERILEGRISIDAAAVLGRFFENAEELGRGGDDWLKFAEDWTARKLERELRKRMRESETGGPVSVLECVLTSKGREKFERARQVACRKKNKILDEGQTVEVLSEHYLDSFDFEEKEPRKRRMPDTTGRPGRTIPAEVKREVLARQGDRCANPICDNEIFLQYAHDEPHALGGSREADNLDRLCFGCHLLVDNDLLIIEGPPGKRVFKTPDGQILRKGRPPGADSGDNGGDDGGKGADTGDGPADGDNDGNDDTS